MAWSNMQTRIDKQRAEYEARKAKHLPEIRRMRQDLNMGGNRIAAEIKANTGFVYRVIREEKL